MSVGDENYINLGDNTVTEGLVYRITPFTTSKDGKALEGVKNFDTQKTYDNIMHRFKFGGLDKKGIYLDETVMRMCYTHRRIMAKLAIELLLEEEFDKAEEVLRYLDKQIPAYNVPHNYSSGSMDIARAWALLENEKQAMTVLKDMWKNSSQYLRWYISLSSDRMQMSQPECYLHFYVLQQVLAVAQDVDPKWAESRVKQLSALMDEYEAKGGKLGY